MENIVNALICWQLLTWQCLVNW